MLWDDQQTRDAIARIKKGARTWTSDELADSLTMARARKDKRIDKISVGAESRYNGDQRDIIVAALKTLFPNTNDMPVSPINLLKLIARLDAGVNVVPADRFLEDEKGARVKSTEPSAKLWTWALRKSRLQIQMAEAERWALITPGVCVGHVPWVQQPGGGGRPRIDLYGAHNVEVICHPAAPTSWEHRYFLAFRQAAPDLTSGAEWFLVYSRVPPDTLDGKWGPWDRALLSTKGEQFPMPPFGGKLCPAFLVQFSDPRGHVFTLTDPDLLDTVDDFNTRRSNESFVTNLQGHDQLWTDDINEASKMKTGPDAMMRVQPDSQVGLLSPQPKLSDMRESRDQALRELATSRGNSPHAYVTKDSGNPTSGVGMRIENIAHDTRVAEQAVLMQALEEEEVLPILLDTMIAHHPQGRVLLSGLVPRMIPRKPPAIEEPQQKMDRLTKAVDLGWIPAERAAADLELYPDVDVAKNALDDIARNKPKPVAPAAPAKPEGDTSTDATKTPTGGKPPSPPPAKKPFPPKPENDDDEKKRDDKKVDADEAAKALTLNELTLGIERMGRIGDVDTVNILRKALALTLGVPYEGDLKESDLEKKPEP